MKMPNWYITRRLSFQFHDFDGEPLFAYLARAIRVPRWTRYSSTRRFNG